MAKSKLTWLTASGVLGSGSSTPAAAPEINVKGNSVSIPNGNATPSALDHTDFGATTIGTTVTRTFTIENTGSADLTLSNPTVPSRFTRTVDPTSPVAAAGSTTFQVRSDAVLVGTHTGNISITNNDSDENPYSFAISSTVNMITANLIAWHDANSPTTLWQDSGRTTQATADGDVIGAWDDKSSNAYHQLQTTTTNKPVLKLNIQNSLPVIRFDGTDNYLTKDFGASYAQPNTIFLVANFRSAAGDFIFDTPAGTNRNVFSDGAGTTLTFNAGTALSYSAGHSLPTGFKLWRIVANGVSSAVFLNGVSKASGNAGTNALTGMILGARFSVANFGEVDFCEMAIYAGTLSAGNITAIEAYLTAKWGIV